MASFLHSVGTGAFRKKWIILAVWVVLLVILAVVMATHIKPTSGSISIPGTQAQKALDRFNELFPSAGGQSGRVVLEAQSGKKITDYKTAIDSFASKVKTTNEVVGVVSPFDNAAAVSSDGTIAYITVQLKATDGGTVSNDTIDSVDTSVETLRDSGVTAETGGDLVKRVPGEILGIGEVGGVVIALIVLLITLGSLVAAGLPIIIALVTIGISMAGLFSLSQVIDINSTTPALAVMLGLAVGIDYSLFIINRYRVFVHEGYELQEAIGRAVATAGSAVLFAATTVVIALASLSVVQIPFMTTMGLSAAATVAIAATVAVTLIPALLGIAGMKVFGRKARKDVVKGLAAHQIHEDSIKTTSIWYRIASALLKYRIAILAASLALLVVLASPVRELTLGLPTDETAAKDSSARKAYDLMAKGFGAGYNAPLLIVVEGVPAVSDADKATVRQQITQQYLAANPGTLTAATPAQVKVLQTALEQQVNTYAPYYELSLVANEIAKQNDVKVATPILTTDNGTKGVIQVIPKTGPSDPATKALVTRLRTSATQSKLTSTTGVTFAVTGSTAVQIDVNDKLAAALPVYLSVVIGLSLILLMVAFRSILIPIKATLGFLLSVFVMFGALVAVFQWGWFGIAAAPGPIVSFIPIIGIGILFGLAMDYEFFLVSGMQEAHHHTKNPRLAVLRGYALGSRVVVAAALIMVSVFTGFVGNSDTTIQSLGFALAFGIFVDAFIVRLTIVPIVMSLLGRSAWWLPKWLNKILPHISIEGNER